MAISLWPSLASSAEYKTAIEALHNVNSCVYPPKVYAIQSHSTFDTLHTFINPLLMQILLPSSAFIDNGCFYSSRPVNRFLPTIQGAYANLINPPAHGKVKSHAIFFINFFNDLEKYKKGELSREEIEQITYLNLPVANMAAIDAWLKGQDIKPKAATILPAAIKDTLSGAAPQPISTPSCVREHLWASAQPSTSHQASLIAPQSFHIELIKAKLIEEHKSQLKLLQIEMNDLINKNKELSEEQSRAKQQVPRLDREIQEKETSIVYLKNSLLPKQLKKISTLKAGIEVQKRLILDLANTQSQRAQILAYIQQQVHEHNSLKQEKQHQIEQLAHNKLALQTNIITLKQQAEEAEFHITHLTQELKRCSEQLTYYQKLAGDPDYKGLLQNEAKLDQQTKQAQAVIEHEEQRNRRLQEENDKLKRELEKIEPDIQALLAQYHLIHIPGFIAPVTSLIYAAAQPRNVSEDMEGTTAATACMPGETTFSKKINMPKSYWPLLLSPEPETPNQQFKPAVEKKEFVLESPICSPMPKKSPEELADQMQFKIKCKVRLQELIKRADQPCAAAVQPELAAQSAQQIIDPTSIDALYTKLNDSATPYQEKMALKSSFVHMHHTLSKDGCLKIEKFQDIIALLNDDSINVNYIMRSLQSISDATLFDQKNNGPSTTYSIQDPYKAEYFYYYRLFRFFKLHKKTMPSDLILSLLDKGNVEVGHFILHGDSPETVVFNAKTATRESCSKQQFKDKINQNVREAGISIHDLILSDNDQAAISFIPFVDLTLQNSYGATPYELARILGKKEICSAISKKVFKPIVQEAKAIIEEYNNTTFTVSQYAIKHIFSNAEEFKVNMSGFHADPYRIAKNHGIIYHAAYAGNRIYHGFYFDHKQQLSHRTIFPFQWDTKFLAKLLIHCLQRIEANGPDAICYNAKQAYDGTISKDYKVFIKMAGEKPFWCSVTIVYSKDTKSVVTFYPLKKKGIV